MKKNYNLLNVVLFATALSITYFVFRMEPHPLNMPPQTKGIEEPSMVPGAEAVRPLAAEQSQRMKGLLTGLTPVESSSEKSDRPKSSSF